jgi:hypothetical protein
MGKNNLSYPFTSPANSSVGRCPSLEPLGRPEEGRAFLLSTALNEYNLSYSISNSTLLLQCSSLFGHLTFVEMEDGRGASRVHVRIEMSRSFKGT